MESTSSTTTRSRFLLFFFFFKVFFLGVVLNMGTVSAQCCGRTMCSEDHFTGIEKRLEGLPPIVWRVPIGCDFSGFFVEVLGYILGLENYLSEGKLYVDIGKCSEGMLQMLSPGEARVLRLVQGRFIADRPAWKDCIVIHHKLPNSPFAAFLSTTSEDRPMYSVGRMMTEATILQSQEVLASGDPDEVWVPTAFHVDVFVRHGVPHSKLFIAPEAVNIAFFGEQVIDAEAVAGAGAEAEVGDDADATRSKPSTVRFLSIFKFEHRKGPDILLQAYWRAFSEIDNVELLLRSYRPRLAALRHLCTHMHKSLPTQTHKSLPSSIPPPKASLPQSITFLLLPQLGARRTGPRCRAGGNGTGRPPNCVCLLMCVLFIASEY